MMSSLIHSNPECDPSEDATNGVGPTKKRPQQSALNFKSRKHKKDAQSSPRATLLVAPLSLLSQWKAELERSSQKGTIQVHIYHGTSKVDLDTLLDEVDADQILVVITSFGTLSSEHGRVVRGGTSWFYDSTCPRGSSSLIIKTNRPQSSGYEWFWMKVGRKQCPHPARTD